MVYDSMYNDMILTRTLICFIKMISVIHTQKQHGPDDCGLFALAFSTSLANGLQSTIDEKAA